MRFLLEHGVSVNARVRYRLTALFAARAMDKIQLLLARGAEVDAERRDGKTPLMLASAWTESAKVDLLLRHGADVNHRDANGETALLRAVQPNLRGMDPSPVVSSLLAAGADPDGAPPDSGWTPLLSSVSDGRANLVDLLLAASADPWREEVRGRNAVFVAAQAGYRRIQDTLVAVMLGKTPSPPRAWTCAAGRADGPLWKATDASREVAEKKALDACMPTGVDNCTAYSGEVACWPVR